jgi:hypothetical protein
MLLDEMEAEDAQGDDAAQAIQHGELMLSQGWQWHEIDLSRGDFSPPIAADITSNGVDKRSYTVRRAGHDRPA